MLELMEPGMPWVGLTKETESPSGRSLSRFHERIGSWLERLRARDDGAARAALNGVHAGGALGATAVSDIGRVLTATILGVKQRIFRLHHCAHIFGKNQYRLWAHRAKCG